MEKSNRFAVSRGCDIIKGLRNAGVPTCSNLKPRQMRYGYETLRNPSLSRRPDSNLDFRLGYLWSALAGQRLEMTWLGMATSGETL